MTLHLRPTPTHALPGHLFHIHGIYVADVHDADDLADLHREEHAGDPDPRRVMPHTHDRGRR